LQASPEKKQNMNNQQGIALVTALLMTLILTLVVIALAHRVGMFSVGSREFVVKSQNLYTAEIGLNESRYFLMANDCLPPNFEACIPSLQTDALKKQDFADKKLIEISGDVSAAFSTALPEFTVAGDKFNIGFNGTYAHNTNDIYNFKTYVKQTNMPKVLNVVAVANRPGTELAKTVIDAGLIYTKPIGGGYKQQGGGETREGLSGETLGSGATTPRTNF